MIVVDHRCAAPDRAHQLKDETETSVEAVLDPDNAGTIIGFQLIQSISYTTYAPLNRISNLRVRSNSPPPPPEDHDTNPGDNLFITGLSYKTASADLEELFNKYGKVQKAEVIYDPHTRESRGFAFIRMNSGEDADRCVDNLNGMLVDGRAITVEKAKRSRPRTPTPGRYYGPPKRGKNDEPLGPSAANSFSDRPSLDSRGRPERVDRRYEPAPYYDRYERDPRPSRYDRYDRYDRSMYVDRGAGYDRYDRYERDRYDRYDRERRPPPGRYEAYPPRQRSPY
jgi:transformer-2 protein